MTTATAPHTERAHAKLAPSAAHRWMNCPGSVAKAALFPNTSSVYAAEGTAAHELCAFCLSNDLDPNTFIDQWIDINHDGENIFVDLDDAPTEEGRFFQVTDEMAEAVSEYCTYVDGLRFPADSVENSELEVEQKLDMRHIHPEIFGTGDALVYDPGKYHLHVIDFKYGKGVAVDADDNPQLLLYAAGAAKRLGNRRVDRLTVHVVQPRASHAHGPIREFEIDIISLFDFEGELAIAAAKTEAPDAIFAAGEWCRFCPAMAACETARLSAVSAAAAEFGDVGEDLVLTPPHELSPEKIANILHEADSIGAYVKAVQQFAHDEAMAGRTPKGFKLVAKRANRKWGDTVTTVELLDKSTVSSRDELFVEPKLKSPAQLEKFFPGKNKEERQKAMADLVVKKSGGVNLVPLTDPRPAVEVGANADFEAVEGVA